MNFDFFPGTHVRIAEQEATPPSHISLKPCLSFDPYIYVFVVKVATQNDRSNCKKTCVPFLLESRGWLRKTANKNDNTIFLFLYINIQWITLFYFTRDKIPQQRHRLL